MRVKLLNLSAWLFWSILLLGGCSNLDSISTSTDLKAIWSRQLLWLEGLQHWRATGRVAVRSASDAGSASIHWQQAPANFSLRLYGPFGQGTVLIEGQHNSVSLRRADGQITRAPSAEELLFRELGWSVPVSVLRYWILGRPAPGYPVEEFRLNGAGLLGRLSQAGWQVNYQGYREAGEGTLPDKFELRREALLVRVVLSDWQFSE